jgi:hypothetical protein
MKLTTLCLSFSHISSLALHTELYIAYGNTLFHTAIYCEANGTKCLGHFFLTDAVLFDIRNRG